MGKSTVADRLVEAGDGKFVQSISATTRPPRGDEKEGEDYYFLTPDEFEKKVQEGEFLETTQVYEHRYGTLKKAVEEQIKKGKKVIVVVDVNGLETLKQLANPLTIFLDPPSFDVLKERLEGRKTDSEQSIASRLAEVEEEMKKGHQLADFVVVNDDLDQTVEQIEKLIRLSGEK